MRDLKYRIELFSLYDHTNIEKHLKKMAAKGWMLEKIGRTFWVYNRIEPQNINFSAVYYPKDINKGKNMSEDRQNFIDMCTCAGWNFVLSSDKLHIFCCKNNDCIPIETDAQIQLECIHKFAKSEIIYGYFFFIIAAVIYTAFSGYLICKEPIETLSDSLDAIWFWPFFIPFSLYNIIKYLIWHKNAKAAAERGEFYETKRIIRFEVLFWLPLYIFSSLLRTLMILEIQQILFLIFLIIFAAILVCIFKAIRKAYSKTKLSENAKLFFKFYTAIVLVAAYIAGIVLIYPIFPKSSEKFKKDSDSFIPSSYTVYHHKNLPVNLEDLIPINGVVSKYKFNDYLLLINLEKTEQYSLEDNSIELSCDITHVNFSPIFNACKKEIITISEKVAKNGFTIKKEADASVWNADEVYRYYKDGEPCNSYVVCIDDKIIQIIFGWEATNEQIAIAAEKLKNA